jgi:hypothetical protein
MSDFHSEFHSGIDPERAPEREQAFQTSRLDDLVERLQAQVQEQSTAMREQNASLSSRFARERLRWRVQAGLAMAATVAALLLSPAGRQAIAQENDSLTNLTNLTNLTSLTSPTTLTDRRLAALEAKTRFMNVIGRTTIFARTNVRIVSGSGSTDGAVNGLGNLIVGYNEDVSGNARTGSHNLVVGADQGYTSFGGLVAGYGNQIPGIYCSVSGGQGNTVSGDYSSVSGGIFNTASGYGSAVSGGHGRWARSTYGWAHP